MPTFIATNHSPRKLSGILALCLALCVIGAGVMAATASANGGIFCYNIALGQRGASNDHCYSNWDRPRVAEAWSTNAYAWVWLWNEAHNESNSSACYSNGCRTGQAVVFAGRGYEENANLSGYSSTFYGEWSE